MVQLKIKEVKQGHKPVDNYIVQFKEFKDFTGFNNAALIEIFKEGLSSQILSHCYSLETTPIMLTAWKEKGCFFYHNYVKLQQHHQGSQPHQQQQQACHQPQPGSSCQGAHNPLVPSSNPAAPVKSELTDTKLGQTHHDKCYHCSREGHWAAHSVTPVPDMVEDHSKATRSEQLTCQSHSLRKGSMTMREERGR
jgi:hypothetical protein